MKLFFAKFIFILAVFSLLTIPPITFAANNKPTQVVLSQNQTINHDYFAAGNSVTLNGTVNGDAYIAGGNILINGPVNGSLLVAGGTVDVRGPVTGNIRAVGGQLTVSSHVGGNVSMAGGSLQLTDNAVVDGSLVLAGGQLSIFAPVGKGIVLAGGSATLGNKVGNDVNAFVRQLIVTPSAKISGALNFTSNQSAQIQQGATIGGKVTHNYPQGQTQISPQQAIKAISAAIIIGKLISFVSSLVLGLLLLAFVPLFFTQVAENIYQHAWLSLGIGLVILIITPIIAILLLMTVVGIPLGILLFIAYGIYWYFAKIFVSLFIGEWLLRFGIKKPNIFGAFILGLVVYFLITLIPIIGGIIAFISLILGMGSLLITKQQVYLSLRSKKLL